MDDKKIKDYHDEMLRTFARGVAHNFNNILTAGMGFLALAMEQTQDDSTLALLRNVELCHQRITYLARQLLSFTGDEQTCLADVRIYEVLRNALNLFDSIALKHRAVMVCDFASIRDVLVRVDEFRLLQVLVQILNNAAESLQPGKGRIVFRGRVCEEHVYIEIEDNGVGICEADLPKIFSPFYTSKQVVGVGLGLSMAKAVVENFGGTLKIVSQEGTGTQVCIALPLRQYEARGVLPGHLRAGELRSGVRVLVAVDADQTRQALEAVLLSHDFYVDSADCEEEMLARLQRRSGGGYDVIIVDLLHSDYFGDALIALIRQYTDAPVLALYMTQREVPSAASDVAALPKPFDPPELMRALRGFSRLLRETDA